MKTSFIGVGNFTGTGSAQANTITGGTGNDILDGGAGVDRLIGGAGNDTYFVDVLGDITTEVAGAAGGVDTANVTANTYVLGPNVENMNFVGSGNFIGTGNADANVITGGASNDTLNGVGGNDTLFGLAGNNSLLGGLGIDTASYATAAGAVTASLVLGVGASANGFGGQDTFATIENLTGSNQGDTLTGDLNANVIDGGGGDDTLNGGAGNDTIIGGAGTNTINQLSTDGRDFIDGGGTSVDVEKDTYRLTGVAAAETFNIYTRSAYLALVPAAVLNANTEIVVTRNGTAVTNIIAELDNIEEITVNALDTTANDGNGVVNGGANGGDTINIIGDFTETSLDFNTITIGGTPGNDVVNIAGLTSEHRIVFNTAGGTDTVVGTLRPQDVVNGASQPAATQNPMADWDLDGYFGGNDGFMINAGTLGSFHLTPAMIQQLAPLADGVSAALAPAVTAASVIEATDMTFDWFDDNDQQHNLIDYWHGGIFN